MTSAMFNLRNVVLLCSLVALTESRQLPSFIKPCKKNDPHLDQCLINLINGLKPKLAKGIPEMRIPSLEPFYVPLVKLDQGSEAVNFKATFKNLTLRTGLVFDVKKVKIDFSKPSIFVDVLFPRVKLDSVYNIDGKVLVVPIKGDGLSTGNLTDVSVQLTVTGKYVPKNGKTFLQILTRKINFKLGNLKLHFDNLFGGKNKALTVWLKACRRTDPKLNDCLRHTFQNMFPYLAKGIPEIGIQPLEPMHIEKVGIVKGQGGVTLQGAFNNLIVHGPSNTTALYTRLDLKKGRLDIGLFIPLIKVEAKYDLKGNILLLPLVGIGDAKLYLKNVTTNVQTRIVFPKVKNEEVMVATSMRVDFSLALMRVHLSNLFNGNIVLGRTVNQFLNENSKEVVNELKENIGESLAGVFKKIMNDAFSHIPTRLWLLDDPK
ncbi:hypothetical protein V9T40_009139 [Parthenolecanium corni]|uniref:Uncharacterized protein n=1 Tax=Parthenolecanium corni TaxID=536013 RepID=A0AAN9Y6H8_9HEMI